MTSHAQSAAAAGHESAGSTQAGRIREAVSTAVRVGPAFLSGSVDAVTMANAMVEAVHTYLEAERADGRDGTPVDDRSRQLYPLLEELEACGGGFLAGRCDADCVARTVSDLVDGHRVTTE